MALNYQLLDKDCFFLFVIFFFVVYYSCYSSVSMTGQMFVQVVRVKKVVTILNPTIARLFSIQRGLDWGKVPS